ncbi:MAG: tRNA pseudouridine(13) synthase TruD [Desulfurococcaceae archaeon]|nr:tRNA pseudouridine(13) synthase TruD [Desulfurococcaceae archaeon]
MPVRSNNPLDLAVGMLYYSRPDVFLGASARATLSPSTFKVFERVYGLGIAKPPGDRGDYAYNCLSGSRVLVVVCKRGVSTFDVAEELSNLGFRISFWGLKDAGAYSCQFMVLNCPTSLTIPRYLLEGAAELFPLREVGLDFRVGRHQLAGNLFEVLMEVAEGSAEELSARIAKSGESLYLNYFGYQRFGYARPVNHLIGRAIVLGDYESALHLLLGKPSALESPEAQVARRLFEEGDYRGALEKFPRSLRLERRVLKEYLRLGNPRKALLRSVPPSLLRFLVEAYQSYLFNLALSRIFEELGDVEGVSRNCELLDLPRPSTPTSGCSRYSAEVIAEDLGEGVGKADSSLMSAYARETTFAVENLSTESVSETALTLRFELRRGSYATVYLRELLREGLTLGSL